MRLSYEGIGQWAATFACDEAEAGQVMKLAGNGQVADCAAGEDFGGVVVSVARDGGACAMALGGLVTVGYTGTAPAVGWVGLSADGNGGVQADKNGRVHLVVDVDESGKTVTFML
jgi:hypothetical protein